MGVDTTIFNQAFGDAMGNPAQYEKVAAAQARVIEDHLAVTEFGPQFMDRERITPDDPNLVPSLTQDTVEYRVEMRPRAKGMTVTFTGRGGGEIIQAPRLAVGLFSMMSPKHFVVQERLWAYKQNIVEYLKNRAEITLGDVSDLMILQFAERLVRKVQVDHDGADGAHNTSNLVGGAWEEMSIVKGENARNATADNFIPRNLEREDIVRVMNMRGSDYRLTLRHGLFTENDVRTLGLFQNLEYGDRVAEITDKGWTKNELSGMRIQSTLKGNICRRGNAYFISEKDYGCLFVEVLGTQFWGKREANKIYFQIWRTQGAAFLHSLGVVKLELYSGSSNILNGTTFTDTNYEKAIPVPEGELGDVVNKAASDDLWVPITEAA